MRMSEWLTYMEHTTYGTTGLSMCGQIAMTTRILRPSWATPLACAPLKLLNQLTIEVGWRPDDAAQATVNADETGKEARRGDREGGKVPAGVGRPLDSLRCSHRRLMTENKNIDISQGGVKFLPPHKTISFLTIISQCLKLDHHWGLNLHDSFKKERRYFLFQLHDKTIFSSLVKIKQK